MALVQASVSFLPSAGAIQGDEGRQGKEDQEQRGGLRIVSSLGRGKIVEADRLYSYHHSSQNGRPLLRNNAK